MAGGIAMAYRKKASHNLKWFVLMILTFILLLYSFNFMDKIIKPSITSIAEVKVKAIITQLINESIQEEFVSDIEFSNLIKMQKDEEGNVTFVESNAIAMNMLASKLVISTQDKFKTMKPIVMKIPIGALLGNAILSQIGPSVNFKIMPIGMAKISFKTEFESGGINQTKYKVYLDFQSQAKVLVPFTFNIVDVDNTILVAEAIIVGKVPQSYVNVPPEDITNVIGN